MAAGRQEHRRGIGNVLAPARFIVFAIVTAVAIVVADRVAGLGLRHGVMAGFDVGALLFLLLCVPLVRQKPDEMRVTACKNDANRAVLLAITGGVSLVILAAVASELMQKDTPRAWSLGLIIGTLAMSWIFSNFIYALHYAHLFYSEDEADCDDAGGLTFPDTPEPDYWDFIYFAVCLGMTFQTSDVTITDGRIRNVVTVHCLAAFVFNLGVLGFTINVLGGSH
jgi:uncharacterized membrane protein